MTTGIGMSEGTVMPSATRPFNSTRKPLFKISLRSSHLRRRFQKKLQNRSMLSQVKFAPPSKRKEKILGFRPLQANVATPGPTVAKDLLQNLRDDLR